MIFDNTTLENFSNYLGEENLRYFKHLKGLTGTYSPVLNLNYKKKGIPSHPVHFREGMQIRNWMRGQTELFSMSAEDLDNKWVLLVEQTVNLKMK